MALEAWWTLNYERYSLSELQRLPIYHKLLQTQYPFQRAVDSVREAYESSLECDAYLWQDDSTDREERLTHNRKTDEYSYELRFRDGKKTVRVKSHKRGEVDWGEVRKEFKGWELIEGWRSAPPDKEYSRFTEESGVRKGVRMGLRGDGERWVIEEWQQADESTYRKSYEKEGTSGGESIVRKDTHCWGEEWFSATDTRELKCWEEIPDRRWGHSSAYSPRGKEWQHCFDFSATAKFDERLSFNNERVVGYRYRQTGNCWLKEEWEGLETLEVTHDDWQVCTAQYRLQLGEVHAVVMRNLRAAAANLQMLREKDASGDAWRLLGEVDDFPELTSSDPTEVHSSVLKASDLTHRVEILIHRILVEVEMSDKAYAEKDAEEQSFRRSITQGILKREESEEWEKLLKREAEYQRTVAELEASNKKLQAQAKETQEQLDRESEARKLAERAAEQAKAEELEAKKRASDQLRILESELRAKQAKDDDESRGKRTAAKDAERVRTLEKELERRKTAEKEAEQRRTAEREAEKRSLREVEARASALDRQLKEITRERETTKVIPLVSQPGNLPSSGSPVHSPPSSSSPVPALDRQASGSPGLQLDIPASSTSPPPQLPSGSRFLSPKSSPKSSDAPKRRGSAFVSPDLAAENSDLIKQVALLKAELAALKGGRASPSTHKRTVVTEAGGEESGEKQPQSAAEGESVDDYITLQAATDRDFEAAERLLRSESLEAVENNIILQTMKKTDPHPEKLLTNLNLFKFLEELMDKKLEVDNADLAAHRKPRTMTEFLMEHLNRMFGIKSLAMKFLGQLMPTLFALVQEGHKYAVLYARILQVFHPRPVPLQLAMVIVRLKPEFQKLVEKCSKEREARDSKRGLKAGEKSSAPSKPGIQQQMDLMGSGGEAFVADVMMLLYDFFDNDRESGELALQLLRPAQVSLTEFILFKMCHKMAKLGMREEAVFSMIDLDGGGTIDREEFVEGIRSSLDLWVSTSDIVSAFDSLTNGQEITRELFLEKCSFDWYQQAVKSDDYTISKCDFLTLMTEVYDIRQRRDVAGLMALFQQQEEDPLTETTFRRILKSLNRRIPAARVERMWRIAISLSTSSEGLNQDTFLKVMLRYRTGPFAATRFCKPYADTPEIESAVEERKMGTVDIAIKQASDSSVLIGNKEVSASVRKAGQFLAQGHKATSLLRGHAKK